MVAEGLPALRAKLANLANPPKRLVQTVLLHNVDGRTKAKNQELQEPDFIVCEDMLYADDTLLLSSKATKMQRRLDIVVRGMESS